MPKISVIMPVYNGISFLGEAIESILIQTETDFEFIIMDDGSTEPVLGKIQSYQDSRIRAHRSDKNEGLTTRLNDCLDLVRGDFIVRMDGDDISHPMRLEKQLHSFEKGVGFVGCWGNSIDIKGNPIIHYVDTHCRCTNEDLVKIYPHTHCMIDASIMFTREVFNKIGYYDLGTFHGESYNYCRRIQQFYKGWMCCEVLYTRRVGSSIAPRQDGIDIFALANQRALSHTIIKEKRL